MNLYENTYSVLKECSEPSKTNPIQEKYKQLIIKKNKLIELLNFERIEKTQKAVDDRMGPKLCDNSEQQSKQTKRISLSLLSDYQKHILTLRKQEQEVSIRTKMELEDKMNMITQRFQSIKVRASIQLERLQKKKEEISQQIGGTLEDNDFIIYQKEQQRLEDEIDIKLLDIQLKQRKSLDQLHSIISKIYQIA